MKKTKKKFIAIFAGCMFAMMMMLNVSTTINGSNFNVNGYIALVNGNTGGGSCYLNARQKPGGGMCFVCTTTESSQTCTSDCGSEVCW